MSNWMRRLRNLGLAAALVPAAAWSTDEVNVSKGATLAGPGLAAHGYDVVAYFAQGGPLKGSDRFATAYAGATYRFASQENLDAFRASPEKYVPAYGGFCAFGVALAKKFDGDPLVWKIHAGRLYLNLNEEIQQKWSRDLAGQVAKADANWRAIAARAVADL
jgi:YHS domain-containing protein